VKVLFNTFPLAFQHPGGGELIMTKLQEELEKIDVEVLLFNPFKDKIVDVDLIHYFSLIGWENFKSLANFNKPLVVTPTSWCSYSNKSKIKEIIKDNALKFYHRSQDSHSLRSSLKYVSKFYPTTEEEKNLLQNYYDIEPHRFEVIPNGVTPIERNLDMGRKFIDQFKVSNFALYVGSIQPNKNVHLIIQACTDLSIPLVIMGAENTTFPEYATTCREISKNGQVHFIGPQKHLDSTFTGAYNAASVVINASDFETCSLVGLETGSLGRPLIITSGGATKNIYKQYVEYINPPHFSELKGKIKKLYGQNDNTEFQDYILKNFSWAKVAKDLKKSYENLISAPI